MARPFLLDGRTPEQFVGEAKHGKARAGGRIPGAVLLSQSESFDEAAGKLKGRDELAKIYGDVDGGQIVSYCNTGHWAATNWFVLSEVLGRGMSSSMTVPWSNGQLMRPIRC